MKKVLALIVVAIVIVGAFLLFQNKSSTPTTPLNQTTQTDTTATTPAPTTTTSAVKSFTVVGSNYAFAPKTLSVNKGDTVKITFQNSAGFHDLKIDEFNASTQRISAGQSETIQFVADKTGSFQYYCSVGSHRAMGMWGTLTVN